MTRERSTYDVVRNDGTTIRVNKEEFDADRQFEPPSLPELALTPVQTERALSAMGMDSDQVAKFIAFAKTL